MGYGVIESNEDEIAVIDYGGLVSKECFQIGERLNYFYGELRKIIQRHQPDGVAVEQPFVAKNVRTALAIGRAQAVALLAAATDKIPSFEYTPARIKQMVANYGASGKEQIQEMVRLQLGLTEVPQPDDAADALAVAICHLREVHVNNLLTGQGGV